MAMRIMIGCQATATLFLDPRIQPYRAGLLTNSDERPPRHVQRLGCFHTDTEMLFQFGVGEQRKAQLWPLRLPFQLQVNFLAADGSRRLHVFAESMPISDKRAQCEGPGLNSALVSAYAAQSMAVLALEGRLVLGRKVMALFQEVLTRSRAGPLSVEQARIYDNLTQCLAEVNLDESSSMMQTHHLGDKAANAMYALKRSSTRRGRESRGVCF